MITPNIARFMYLIHMFQDIDPETEIKPWSKASLTDPYEMMYYDDSKPENENDDAYDVTYPIIMDKCFDEIHHDIISTYDDFVDDNVEIRLAIDREDGHKYISIIVYSLDKTDSTVYIEIQDGDWYLS